MARAWFYLTLWRGTPPEFTTEAEAAIGAEPVQAEVWDGIAAEAEILQNTDAPAVIRDIESAEAEIITEEEVVWRVGIHGDQDP